MIRRLPVLIAVAAAFAASPPPAHAGTYTVSACLADGINRSWQTFHSDEFTAAYIACPGGANEGMVARSTAGGGVAPGLSFARVFFDAPPGARVVQVSGQMNQNGTGGWQAGLYDEGAGRWAWCGPSCLSTFDEWRSFSVGLSSTRVSALVICGEAMVAIATAVTATPPCMTSPSSSPRTRRLP